MENELLAELSPEELSPPEFYPIEYALMWVAYGNRPINPDYARIIYEKPPKDMINEKLEKAEKKLLAYLRSGKISAINMEYKQDDNQEWYPTGKYEPLDREAWKGDFNWRTVSLHYDDDRGVRYECTHILVKTSELLQCDPYITKPPLDKTLTANQDRYVPAYIDFMLRAVSALNLSPDRRTNKKAISDWLTKNWPSDLEGKSDRLIEYMATLLRRPEDKKGGNTSWKSDNEN